MYEIASVSYKPNLLMLMSEISLLGGVLSFVILDSFVRKSSSGTRVCQLRAYVSLVE